MKKKEKKREENTYRAVRRRRESREEIQPLGANRNRAAEEKRDAERAEGGMRTKTRGFGVAVRWVMVAVVVVVGWWFFIISFIIKLYLIIRVSGRVVDGGWKSGQTASATARSARR